ncbi:AAR061Wp [Eremothecium gossypii ATCC 10895]|uniref:AAR061Wp n=1 Tax=Eremothecium gossypii (strain ATCC 10895 / CBS 109.51 / FGSC 9923 / NRRL Y-1056) TaxID=284811 RepID=Q75EL8_EREGS|nr:AAR061Wp [Eremothecium gossypii ATCC 10895]AAS50426.1 AAR061Wp [Eremothecium gossypii ATCC 10895]AEY94712.1 FAAR061Wp [Eremothecium gossypii FDAG1]
MFRPTLRACSAYSKRNNKVRVQILQNFERFQLYRGEVVNVSPSLMRNYLHRNNGARYILWEKDIDQGLVQEAAATRQRMLSQRAAAEASEPDAEPVTIQKTAETGSPAAEPTEKEAPAEAPAKRSGLSPRPTVADVKIPGLEL